MFQEKEVLQNVKVGAHEIWGGVPAKYIKPTRPGLTDNAKHYVEYSKEYLKELKAEKSENID